MNQRTMPLLGEAKKPELVPHEEIERCEDMTDAIHLCVARGQYRKNYQIADLIDMQPAHFSKCMSGSHHFPPAKLDELMSVCANLAPLQFLAWRMGAPMLEGEREREIRELEERLAKIKRTAA